MKKIWNTYKTELLFFLLGAIVPVGFMIVWHALDRSLPRGDDALYLAISYKIDSLRHTGSLWDWPQALYWTRYEFKPILLPAMGSLFLEWAGHDPANAMGIFNCACLTLLCLYTYGLARQYTSLLGAAIWTAFVGTLPWVNHNFYGFMAEALFLPFTAAALYHLKKSSYFSRQRHAVYSGLWLGLCFCERPIETLLFLTPLTFAITACGFVKKTLNPRDLVLPAFCLAVFGALLLACEEQRAIFETQLAHFLILFYCLILIFAAWTTRRNVNTAFLKAFTLCYCIAVAWHLPFFKFTMAWAYENSFGGGDGNFGPARSPQQYLPFIFDTWKFLVGHGSVILTMLGLLALETQPVRWHTLFRRVFLWSLALIPIAIGATTYNEDPRYYFSGGILLVSGFLALALDRNGKYLKSRCLIVALIVCAHLSFLIPMSFIKVDWQTPFIANLFGLSQPKMSSWETRYHSHDATEHFFKELKGAIKNDVPVRLSLINCADQYDQRWLFNPSLFRFIDQLHGLNIFIEEIQHSGSQPVAELVSRLESRGAPNLPPPTSAHYLLFGPIRGNSSSTRLLQKMLGTNDNAFANWQAGTQTIHGLRFVKALTGHNFHDAEVIHYLVQRTP